MNHLIIIAVMALVARGAFVAMGPSMILFPLSNVLARIEYEWIRKPLGSCSYCMVSAWGIPAVYALGLAPLWYLLPVYLLCAVGLQSMMER
jgi:hypothetical protein